MTRHVLLIFTEEPLTSSFRRYDKFRHFLPGVANFFEKNCHEGAKARKRKRLRRIEHRKQKVEGRKRKAENRNLKAESRFTLLFQGASPVSGQTSASFCLQSRDLIPRNCMMSGEMCCCVQCRTFRSPLPCCWRRVCSHAR